MDNKQGKDIFRDGFSFDVEENAKDPNDGDTTPQDENVSPPSIDDTHHPSGESMIDDVTVSKDDTKDDTNEGIDYHTQENNLQSFIDENENDTSGNNFLSSVNQQAKASFEEEKFSYQKVNPYKKWLIQCLILGSAVIAIYFIVNQKTELIDFTNMAYDDVVAWSNGQGITLVTEEQYSNTVTEDRIISQNRGIGEKIKKDTTVKVVVSKGFDPYESLEVPGFDSSWTKTSIEKWIEQNGIINYTFTYVEDDIVPPNYLIDYVLIGATKESFVRISEIAFTMSYTETVESVVVPDFMKGQITDVDVWAKNNQVTYTYTYENSEIYHDGEVMNQSVKPGEEMSIDETFTCVLSSGIENEMITMENFLNQTIMDVDIWAKNNNIKYSYTYKIHPLYPKDAVFYQSVDAGEDVMEGSSVSFILSNGDNDTIIMEDFHNKSIIDVDIWTKTNHMTYTTAYAPSDIYPKDVVMSQNVQSEQEVYVSESLHFTLSSGPKEPEVAMESFLNKTLLEADIWAKNKGIAYEHTYAYSTIYEKDRIISQSVVPEEWMTSNDTLSFVVSKGKAITVPDFAHMRLADANDYEQESLSISITEAYNEQIKTGKLISQSITAHEKVEEDTEINLIYSLGSRVQVPSFVHGTWDEIETWVDDENEKGASVQLAMTKQANTSYEYGKIMSQSVVNDTVDLSSEIHVTISSGLTVPSFGDMTKTAAKNYSEMSDLNVEVREVYAPNTDAGDFLTQSIEVGTAVGKGTNVVVTYSLGDTINIPRFIDKSIVAMEEWVKSENTKGAAITLNITEVHHPTLDYGIIMAQDIYNQPNAPMETTIDVYVSLGLLYTIPDFSGYSLSEIEAMAEEQQLNIVFEMVNDPSYNSGEVISQEPIGGQTASSKDIVKIKIAK
ncbi:PASTA domain-containing protein [Vallitalea pronyensis]|uniref:PASTA domain-containing protein n=1 Tax=Vallitalea pronyensis TaxID=1348613 RepID=A0A8J8MKW8_9FIRM|nr:PASTA domain-containing protein [Vallitalea pronyensis]QUI23565.1 PASTA domain-containing protein [Vallitalea pronyensis]